MVKKNDHKYKTLQDIDAQVCLLSSSKATTILSFDFGKAVKTRFCCLGRGTKLNIYAIICPVRNCGGGDAYLKIGSCGRIDGVTNPLTS